MVGDRRANLAPPRSAVSTGVSDSRPGLRTVLPVVGALAVVTLWLLSRPYLGIIHDSQIYIGRAVADLDPLGVGRELDFVRDQQSGLSVFGLMARPLVAIAGPASAAMWLTAA